MIMIIIFGYISLPTHDDGKWEQQVLLTLPSFRQTSVAASVLLEIEQSINNEKILFK